MAPLRAAPERQVWRLICRKLGSVSQHEHREARDEGLRLLDRAEVPGCGMCEARPGALDGIAAATDRGVEPVLHVEEQVLEAALRDQHVDAIGEGPLVQLLLWREIGRAHV